MVRAQVTVSAAPDQTPFFRTFGCLFADSKPPLELLCQVKDFAKINREHPDSALPKEIATMLDYASIVAALLRHGQRITSLDNSALGEGMTWAEEQPWLDEMTRALFEEGRAVLMGGTISVSSLTRLVCREMPIYTFRDRCILAGA